MLLQSYREPDNSLRMVRIDAPEAADARRSGKKILLLDPPFVRYRLTSVRGYPPMLVRFPRETPGKRRSSSPAESS